MARKLALIPVLLSLVLLSACKQESTTFGTDARDYTGTVSSAVPTTYSGRVIDGPMQNARVWLDVNGNGVYDKTLSVQVGTAPNQKTLSIPGGEPTAMTGPDGRFSLDVSALTFDPTVARDLDARNYPLMALVIPDKTVDQSGSGAPEKRAYVMMARPGQTVLSPLSTYVAATSKYCVQVSGSCDTAVTNIQNTLGVAINLESDYVKANDPVSAAYGRAFGYFLGLETPDSFNQTLSGTDGLANVFDAKSLRVLNTILLKEGPSLVSKVDQAAASSGGYANVDPSQIGISKVPNDVTDPEMLFKQTVYLNGATEPSSSFLNELNLSSAEAAVLNWKYTPDGQVTEISVDGYMEPSLIALSKLAGASGYTGRMESPGLLWFFDQFNPNQASSTPIIGDGKPEERLYFDWSKNTAYYYSVYSGHGATGSTLGSLGDPPQDTFSWSVDGSGRITRVSDDTRTLTITYATSTGSRVASYEVTQNGTTPPVVLRSWNFGTPTICTVPLTTPQADTYDVPATVTENQNAANVTHSMSWAYDNRYGSSEMGRIQRLTFINSGLTSANTSGFYEWEYGYPASPLDSSQPNLIDGAYLTFFKSYTRCGSNMQPPTSYLYAYVKYSYERLSQYVLENFQ